jgi:hypothetical protein
LNAEVKNASRLVQVEQRENEELRELIRLVFDAAQSKFGVIFVTATQLCEFLLIPEMKSETPSQHRANLNGGAPNNVSALSERLAAAESKHSNQIAKLWTVIADLES